MAMAITIDGVLAQLLVTPAGGTMSVYTLSNNTVLERIEGNVFSTVPVTEDDPFTGYNSGGTLKTPNYRVIVQEVNQPPLIIQMGSVTNQATWTNDEAGMEQCISDIEAALP